MASHRIPFESLSTAERSRLMADNDRLRQQLRDRHRLADLAGNSAAIRRVCDLIAQVAPSAHSVSLQGEEGVGKTRAARALHAASTRSTGPFVVVSCGSMLDADADAQLFGLGDEPARDSAHAGGCVGRAVGGTLYFDDVARLGSLVQDRLLRLARERIWERPDGARLAVDVRIVVAMTRSLESEVTAAAETSSHCSASKVS